MRAVKYSKLAAVAMLVGGLATATLMAELKPAVAVGQTAPAFTLQDENGKTVSLSDYAGKVVVLEWTNPNCPVVQRHYAAKTMASLYARYAPKGVSWVAINSTKTATNAVDKEWATKQHIAYPILTDASGAVGHQYGAKSTPHMFVIDKDGKLVYHGGIDNDPQGDMTQGVTNYVAKALDQVLAGKPVTTAESESYGCAVHYAD